MAKIRPFCGVRPAGELAEQIAALPYDVYSSSEAREIVEKNPLSFLKIDRAETQFPKGTDMYSEQVYDRARDTLYGMKESGEFVQDEGPCYYIYALTMEGRTQTGLVCCVSIDDYLNDVVKKHENTREEKELDRIRHVDACGAHTGPIFLTYRSNSATRQMIAKALESPALYDFVSEDGIRHQVWKVEDSRWQEEMTELFCSMDSLYVADGHHRAASAVKVGLKRRAENPGYTGEEEFNYFLSVLFPAEELRIFDYNRIVHKVDQELLQKLPEILQEKFQVASTGEEIARPHAKGEMGMYVDGTWYLVTAKDEIRSEDPVEGLDVSILQNEVLRPLFGIEDLRTDPRMQFVGGIRGLKSLENAVDQDHSAVAFAMYPTSMEELLSVADCGKLMPPKSTWFEPKLRSGLFIHEF
ncbi:DUF1015 family protein [Roseburia hominis]